MEVPFTRIPQPPEVQAAVLRVLESGRYVAGTEVGTFEQLWAAQCHASFCAGVSSGSAALELAIRSLGLRSTLYQSLQLVIAVPALTFVATAMAVKNAGLSTVFCDVDDHGLIDPGAVSALRRVGMVLNGVIPVHLYGQRVDVDAIREAAPGACIIEDAAQAHGALDRVTGDAACYSFYPSKNLGAIGEAGAVVSDQRALAVGVRSYADYGRTVGSKHGHGSVGNNLRMDEVQAAVLAAKLPFLDIWNAQRRQVADWYCEFGVESFTRGVNNVYHLYPVLVTDATMARHALHQVGVQTGMHYPYALPDIFSCRSLSPNARRIASGHITLPMGPGYTREEIRYVAETVRPFLGGGN